MKQFIRNLIVVLITISATLPAIAADGDHFTYGSIKYTVISETEGTCEVRAGDINGPGSNVSGKISIPTFALGYRVIGIGKYAFKNCTKLTEISTPATIEYIRNYAFQGCRNLNSLSVEASNAEIEINAFNNTAIKNLYLNCSTIDKWFQQNTAIESLTIGSSTKNIARTAFVGCTGLKSLTIGNSVIEIGIAAFNGCTGLTTLSLGNSVTTICDLAFKNCSQLTSVEIPASVTAIGKDAFRTCVRLKNVSFQSIEQLCNISFANQYSNPIFYSHKLNIDGNDLSEIIIPSSVKKIGDYAFVRLTDLNTLKIPYSVNEIGTDAFMDCPIKQLEVNCSRIGKWFKDYDTIDSLAIGNSVKVIADSAFYGCSLTSLSIPSSINSIGENSFSKCPISSGAIKI